MEKRFTKLSFRSLIPCGGKKVALFLPLLFLMIFGREAHAQIVIKSFEPRYKTEQPGGIVYVSNNILTCTSCNTNSSSSQNDNNDSKYIDIISDGAVTYNSSSANLNLPDCSTITFAGLYWNGSASATNPRFADRNKVKFMLPGQSFVDLEADVDFGIFQDLYYQYFKDVTSLVKSNGVTNGTYVVGNVVADEKARKMEAGWTLVIVYQQDLEPLRNLTVFDGFVGIPNGAPDLEIPIEGFLTPPTGPVSFELGFVAYEGDQSITGDYLQVNGVTVQDAVHPSNNTFNSKIAYRGSIVTSRSPAHQNTLGYDASIIKPDNSSFAYLKNSATQAKINMATSGDLYAVGVVTTAIDVYNPSFLFTHKYTNLSGGAAVSMNDLVEFEYELTNLGLDQSSNTVFSDQLPASMIFVPGSLQIQTNGGAWSTKTDAANDDQSEYLSAENRVVFRLGSGATGTTGGVVDPNTKIKIRYRARLTSDCDFLRCTVPAISKFGELTFTGTIDKDKQWAVQSTPPLTSGSCPEVGPLTLPLNIPDECLALPADRSFTFDCDRDVADLNLPSGYQLYKADDAGYTTPLTRVTESGSYVARRYLSTGCDYSFNVQVTINRVKILSQPVPVVSCPDEQVSFQVSAEGTGNMFQWQKLTGSTWTDIPGATDATLRMTAAVSDHGSRFRVVVRRSCGPSETSDEATLSITPATEIQSQPQPVSVCEGEDAGFEVAATGENLTYQWQTSSDGASWTDISGATTNKLDLSSVTPSMDGFQYRVLISGTCGTLTSAGAKLTVFPRLQITAPPANVTLCEDESGSFLVTATGEQLTYQWQTNNGGSTWTNIAGATGSSFAISASTNQSGFKYRVAISSTCGSLTSAEATLTVTPKLQITAQPANVTLCEGENGTFTVSATGDQVTYQWQTNNGGSTWTNIAGATGNSFTTTAAGTQNGFGYRAVISSTCGSLTSAAATLTVTPKLQITAPPANVTVCEGENASFTVAATGDQVTYQWQTNNGGSTWTNIAGATGSSLNLSAASTQNDFRYRVAISSTCGSLTSAEATLTVTPKLQITAQPANIILCEDENATFAVAATGDQVTYQWQTNNGGSTWTNIPGATGNSFTTTAAGTQNGFGYRAVISSTCGSLTSAEATLTVTPKLQITAQPANITLCEGENGTFTIAAAGDQVTYQWQTNNGGSTWTNIAGATGNSFTATAVGTRNGFKYRVVLSSTCGSLTSAEATLTVTPTLQITAQPVNTTLCEGENGTFTVAATGDQVTYQWQTNNGGSTWTDITGATGATLTLPAGIAQNGFSYRAVISSTCGSLTSAEAELTVTPKLQITAQPANVSTCEGENSTFTVAATGDQVTYQWQTNNGGSTWTDIAGATGTTLTLSGDIAQNGFGYRAVLSSTCGSLTSAEAILTVTPKPQITAQPVALTICEGENATFTVVATGDQVTYQWQTNNGGSIWTNVAGATGNSFTTTAAGTQNGFGYRAVISSTCGSLTFAAATLTVTPKLQITAPPANVTVCEGENASFTVAATGDQLTYQWQTNNGGSTWTNIAGATGSSFNTSAASSQNGFRYRVAITSTCGSLTSQEAELTVTPKLQITAQPANVTTCEGENGTFTVAATGDQVTYQWQTNSGGSTWTDISGATGTTLTLPAGIAQNGFSYRVAITSTCGSLTSSEAELTVTPKLQITAQPANVTTCEGENGTFTVAATGDQVTYQWQTNNGGSIWTNIAGATGTTLSVPAGIAQNGFSYRVAITSTCGSLTSGEATLTVTPSLQITAQPSNVSTCEGENGTFTVGATGDQVTYQWQTNNGGSTWTDISGATGTTLTLPAGIAQNGFSYRAMISSTCESLTTSEAELTVTPKLQITTQPANVTTCAGENGTFTVAATGDQVTYQWQTNNGGTSWTNIVGATGTTLTLPVGIAQNGFRYRAVLRSTCGSLTSGEATLTVTPKLQITAQPVGLTICEGDDATFTVKATGEQVTYQWQTNNGTSIWTNIAGATGTTLVVPSASARNGAYRVVISSTCGTLTSAEAKLSVTPKVQITVQPESVSACDGENSTFTVKATGDRLTYQWQTNNGGSTWSNISGETGPSLRVPVLTAQHNYRYRVVVGSACGTLTSAEATLTVRKPIGLVRQPDALTLCEGSEATFTVQAEGDNVTYQWQTNKGSASWTDITGATGAALVLKNISPAQDGFQYRVVVSGACNQVTSATARLSVIRKPVITAQPVSVTTCEGTDALFHVEAAGEQLTYQWQINDGSDNWKDLAGQTSVSLTVNALKSQNGYFYRVLVSGPCGTVTSVKAFAWAQACDPKPEITAQPRSVALCTGDPATFRVEATGKNVRYQWQIKLAGQDVWTDISEATNALLDLGRVSYSQNGASVRVVIRSDYGKVESQEAVLKVNAIPSAKPDQFKVEGAMVTGRVDANDSDADQDVLNYAVVTEPGHGTWKLNPDGSFNYTPEAGWSGTTTGRYSVTDGKCTVTAEVTFNVTMVPPVSNDDNESGVQPDARDDVYRTNVDQPVSGSVGVNDAIDQIENPVFSVASSPANGKLTFQVDGKFTYTPAKGFTGTDVFTYRVCAPGGLCSSAKAEIIVAPFTVVYLTPAQSTVLEGNQVSVTARLEQAFQEDVVIRLRYRGKALNGSDYELSAQFQSIRIPKGKLTTVDQIRLYALQDSLDEGPEDVIIEIADASHKNVRIGSGATVIIQNTVSGPGGLAPGTSLEPQPLVSPNGDGNNDFFQIRNIDQFPNNEVLIFNRWGNEVFRVKGYHEGNGNVFRGLANRGLQIGNNDNLPDGVYYYLITPDTTNARAADLLKGYLILKRN